METINNPKVDMEMKNLGAGEQKNKNSIFITDDQVEIKNRQIEEPTDDQFHLQSKGINVHLQQMKSAMENVINANNSSMQMNPRLVDTSDFEQNLPVTRPIKVQQQPFGLLVEYAQEPLLPLVQACAPLSDIIHNLSIYVRLALNETSHPPPDNLTFDESAAIRLYTMKWEQPHLSLHSILNFTLTKSDHHALRPYFKYLKLLLTALVKIPCAPLQTVWLGIAKDVSKDFPQGTSIIRWAFSSCTTSMMALENNMHLTNVGERTLFSIKAINARRIRAHSHIDYKDEILLLPGTYMEVQSQLCPAPDLHIIHLKQIKPTKTLLQLPFEGAVLYPTEKKQVPWYKKKRTIGALAVLISICLAGIIVGSILGTKHSLQSPICHTRAVGINADLFWSFDCGDAREDLKGFYNGIAENGASYSSPDFSGQGEALNLNRALNQYVRLPRSLNLAVNTGFTVSVWILSTGSNQATILSDCNALNSVCIEFSVYGSSINVGIYNWKDQNNAQYIRYNTWQLNHQSWWVYLTFSFNNRSNVMTIYLNGDRLMNGNYSLNRLATTQKNVGMTSYIGSSAMSINRYPFDGLIDQLSISYHVKNSSEILDEATLLCYYNFETDDINVDSGPNNIPADSGNVYRSSSNGQNDLLFNSSDSYFQSSGFTLLMSKSYAFTIAFWLRPIIMKSHQLNSAIAILQLASEVQQIFFESYACFLSVSIINITGDNPYFQLHFGQLNIYWPLKHITVKNYTWTHIGISFSNGSQVSIYLDGINYASIYDIGFSVLLYDPRLAITIGGSYFDDTITIKPSNYAARKCFAQNPEFTYNQMSGEIDDLKVFSRALNDSEFATLASSKDQTKY